MKIGMIQMLVTRDKLKNIENAAQKVAECARNGAEIAVLPEIFNAPYSNDFFRDYAEKEGENTWQALSKMAQDNHVYLVGGSIPEIDDDGRVYNTCFVFDDCGVQIAKYRKMHLFDIDVKGGQSFKESDTFTAGQDICVFESKWGKIGICICFDCRFTELSRAMALMGAQAIIVPAAFNMTTGPAHWETMFRGRAVDNQLFMVGVSPARDISGTYVAYGNSIAVSPWGEVLYCAGDAECTHVAELDMHEVAKIREQLPLLSARRTDIYNLEYKGKI